jgi:hypothetical protein
MAVSTLKSGARIKDGEPGYGLTADDMDVRYEGATFGTYERNGYNDSDFYAVVWTGEAITAIEYATTRGWTYANGASPDATDDVKAAAAAWLYQRDVKSWNVAAAHDALMPEKGRRAEVFKGRKVPVGTTGEIIWVGDDRYRRGAYRVGIKDAAGEVHWTAMDNVRVTDAAERITSLDEITTSVAGRLKRLVETGGPSDWVSAYRSYGGAIGNRFSVPGDQINALLESQGRDEIDVTYAGALGAVAVAEAVREQEDRARMAGYKSAREVGDYTRATAILYGEIEPDEQPEVGGSLMDLARKIEGGS